MSYDDIEIGDTFEFAYQFNEKSAQKGEILYSSVEKQWVQCSGLHVLIAKSKDVVIFANQKGCFHARVDDTRYASSSPMLTRLLPRARG